MKVLVIFNPTSGTANKHFLGQVIQHIEDGGAKVEVYLTRHAGDATTYLRQYQGKLDVVAAAGGDGTLNEVVNGLLERDNQSYRLALIPTGTTNVLAGEVGIKAKPEFIAQTILAAHEQPLYPGRINGRRFMLMAGVGYDAWVVDKVNLKIKRRLGKLAYVLSMLRQLPKFGKTQYRIQIDDQFHHANSAIFTNGRLYGGQFVLSTQADLSAPTIQVLLLKSRSMWSLLYTLLALPLGRMEKMPGVASFAAREVKVEVYSSAELVREPVQADGDVLTQLPLHLQMEKKPLRLLVPQK